MSVHKGEALLLLKREGSIQRAVDVVNDRINNIILNQTSLAELQEYSLVKNEIMNIGFRKFTVEQIETMGKACEINGIDINHLICKLIENDGF